MDDEQNWDKHLPSFKVGGPSFDVRRDRMVSAIVELWQWVRVNFWDCKIFRDVYFFCHASSWLSKNIFCDLFSLRWLWDQSVGIVRMINLFFYTIVDQALIIGRPTLCYGKIGWSKMKVSRLTLLRFEYWVSQSHKYWWTPLGFWLIKALEMAWLLASVCKWIF